MCVAIKTVAVTQTTASHFYRTTILALRRQGNGSIEGGEGSGSLESVGCEDLKKLKKIVNSDLAFVKIKKIQKVNYNKKYVYDLEISNNGKSFQRTGSIIIIIPTKKREKK